MLLQWKFFSQEINILFNFIIQRLLNSGIKYGQSNLLEHKIVIINYKTNIS